MRKAKLFLLANAHSPETASHPTAWSLLEIKVFLSQWTKQAQNMAENLINALIIIFQDVYIFFCLCNDTRAKKCASVSDLESEDSTTPHDWALEYDRGMRRLFRMRTYSMINQKKTSRIGQIQRFFSYSNMWSFTIEDMFCLGDKYIHLKSYLAQHLYISNILYILYSANASWLWLTVFNICCVHILLWAYHCLDTHTHTQCQVSVPRSGDTVQ